MKNTNTIPTVDPVDGFDLGEYRYAVAAFMRTMILARSKDDVRFLTGEEFSTWDLDNIEDDKTSQLRLLRQADTAYEKMWREFIGPNGSGGKGLDDPLGNLKEAVNQFMFGTRPSCLIETLEQKKKIQWRRVAKWNTLPMIREGLDQLPHPAGTPENINPCPVELVDQETRTVRILGKRKQLSLQQRNVIQVLCKAYPGPVDLPDLNKRSGHSGAIGILKRLRKKDADWQRVIKMAGRKNIGYRLEAPKTD